MNSFEQMFGQARSVNLLESIEAAVWTIAALLAVAIAVMCYALVRRRAGEPSKEPDWGPLVENAYEAAEYDKALQILGTYESLRPRSALIKFWQGRCHFQQEAWDKAAEKFEACCRLEPPYRTSVKDYMAFIELNDLVPGVKGYLDE